jgi:hypothetical protein
MRSSFFFALLSVILVIGFAGCGARLPSAGPLPPGLDFSGVWDTNWGQMTLRQRGENVAGRYRGFRNGSVSGQAQGNLLLFRWTQQENRQFGRGYLRMSADGQRLEGRWGYTKNRTNGGRWWATRANR